MGFTLWQPQAEGPRLKTFQAINRSGGVGGSEELLQELTSRLRPVRCNLKSPEHGEDVALSLTSHLNNRIGLDSVIRVSVRVSVERRGRPYSDPTPKLVFFRPAPRHRAPKMVWLAVAQLFG